MQSRPEILTSPAAFSTGLCSCEKKSPRWRGLLIHIGNSASLIKLGLYYHYYVNQVSCLSSYCYIAILLDVSNTMLSVR